MCGISVTFVGSPAAQKPLATFWTEIVMQEVDRLLVPFPAEAEVEREVALDAPIVLTVKSQVVLLEIEIEGAIGQGKLGAYAVEGCARCRAAHSALKEVAEGVTWRGSPVVFTQSVAVLGLEKNAKPPLMLGRKWLGEL